MPDLPILDRDDDQQAVVLALLADAPAAVLEHLDGVFLDVGVRLERRDRRDDHDVAAGALQRADAPVELALARFVDDAGEVVDRARSVPAVAAAPAAARRTASVTMTRRQTAIASPHARHPSTYRQMRSLASM